MEKEGLTEVNQSLHEEIKVKSQSYLSFRIDEELFAIHVMYVNNIIEVPEITRVPDTPEFIVGVINQRGKVLPVIDTCIRFNKPAIKITPLTCILILEIQTDQEYIQMGLLVDAVSEVMEISKTQILPAPQVEGMEAFNDYTEGMVEDNNRFVMILNMGKFFKKELYMSALKKNLKTTS